MLASYFLYSNASPCLFDIKEGGTLVLERGVAIEIKCASESDLNRISLIKAITDLDATDANGMSVYPGLNIIKDTEALSYKIIVTGTTILKGNDANNK